MAAKEKRTQLRYNNNEMRWEDKDGNPVAHPRHSLKPRLLDSRAFRKTYIEAIRKGWSLNEFMKFNSKYPADEVQAEARKFRKAYEQATTAAGHPDSFKLLRFKKEKKGTQLGLEIAGLLAQNGLKDRYSDTMKALGVGAEEDTASE